MKKRVLSIAALMLCLCMLFVSCGMGAGKNAKPSDIYVKDVQVDDTASLTKGEKLGFKGAIVKQAGDLIAVLDGADASAVYRVYNMVTNKVVLEITNAAEDFSAIDIASVDDQTVFAVTKITDKAKNKLATSFYDANGTLIKALEEAAAIEVNADLLVIDNAYYRYENNAFALKFERSKLAGALPDFDNWNEKYYYVMDSDGFVVYSDKGELVSSYISPYMYEDADSEMFVLANGNVLIQTMLTLPEDATEYDVFVSEENIKCDVVTSIFEVKSGKTKDIDLNYGIMFVEARDDSDEFEKYSDKIENVAMILEITDQRIDTSKMKLVSLDNNGKIKMVLDRTLDNQYGQIAIPVAADRYVIETIGGETFLVDGKGKVIGDVSAAGDWNNLYFIADGCLFDITNLTLVYDFEKDEYAVHTVMDNAVILTKVEEGDTKYYVFKQGSTAPEAIAYENGNSAYYVTKVGSEYVYYNDCATEIFRAEDLGIVIATAINSDAYVLQAGENIYRFGVN